MLAKTIIESDPFSDMPLEAQMLYVRLNLAADDDGFVSNPRLIMRSCGACDDSMRLLISKKFVLSFQRGDDFIYLIKHWKIHNTIQKDRYKASAFRDLLREVYLDENKAYSMTPGEGKIPALPSKTDPMCIQSVSKTDTERIHQGSITDTSCIQPVSEVETQIRLDKNRLDLDKSSIEIDQYSEGDCKGEHTEPEAPTETAQQETEDDRIIYFKKNIQRELGRDDHSGLLTFYIHMAELEGIFTELASDPNGVTHIKYIGRNKPS